MSFKVAIMSEDPTNNGYIMKPLIKKVLKSVGKRNANVEMITNPRASGHNQAKRILREGIIPTFSSVDLILFLPDSDGKDRSGEFDDLCGVAKKHGANLICCAAVTEVEAWLLAGHVDRLDDSWKNVRNHPMLKETHFVPFLKKYGKGKGTGGGRSALMDATLKNYRGLKSRCPEIQELEDQIRAFIKTR